MSHYTGSGTILQIAKEPSFKATVDATTLVNHSSESINVSVTKQEEGTLLSGKVSTLKELMSVNVDGSFSFVLNPEFAGLLLHLALGGEDAVTSNEDGESYTHTIALSNANVQLPTFSIFLDKKAVVKKYPGVTVSSLNLECPASDYVKGSIDLKGTEEQSGTINGSNTTFTLPSYRCVGSTLKIADNIFDVSNTTFKIDNALEEVPKTYKSGLYNNRPVNGKRLITLDLSIPYSDEIEVFKDNYLLANSTAALSLEFSTRDPLYKLSIDIPNVMVTSVSSNISGTGLLSSSISSEVVSVGSAEPISVKIIDKIATSYSG